jgi:glycosyltransferase involved in cell wall biosynthesis
MRVLHLYAGNMYGGIERMLVTLARERSVCAEMQPEFGLCFEGQLSQELREAGVPVHMLGNARFSRPWTVWRARRALANLLRRERYDAVICHACWPHALFAGTVRSAGTTLVFWAHGVLDRAHWLDRRSARVPPDIAIANSRFTDSGIAALFPAVRSEVVHCPVPAPERYDRHVIREQLRGQLGAPPSAVIILMASRIEHCKGHAVLIDALAQMRDLSTWYCWIAGAPQREEEEELVDKLKLRIQNARLSERVWFLGHRSDVRRVMSCADIYCQPNVSPESFGISLVEALYEGLPVVTTDIGGGAEIVTSRCGILVPPGDSDALSDALRQLVTDPALRAGSSQCGRARAEDLCSPAAKMRDLHGLLAGEMASKAAA